ncbi:MAG: heavy-metal-associated domain-containing protein [Bacteroidetes bacterium]|nr:MAG: heavy-metal-associated domain-containing protein [Bacteroidota bacterium]
MKYVFLMVMLFGFLGLPAQTTSEKAAEVFGKPRVLTLEVSGMSCTGCADHIEQALGKKDGILEKEVSYPKHRAVVKYDAEKIDEKEIIHAIEAAGYQARVANTEKKSKVE